MRVLRLHCCNVNEWTPGDTAGQASKSKESRQVALVPTNCTSYVDMVSDK